MKYLGIYLTPNLHSLFKHNYVPLLNNIRTDPQEIILPVPLLARYGKYKSRWTFYPAFFSCFKWSLWGVPIVFFTLDHDCPLYLERARVSFAPIPLGGGVALPNFKAYYHAVVFSRIADWKYNVGFSWNIFLCGSDLSTVPCRNLSQNTSPYLLLTFGTDYIRKSPGHTTLLWCHSYITIILCPVSWI